MKIGFMQGRMVKPLHAQIQEFPSKHWEEELVYAKKLNFQIIEWVLDKKSIKTNPFLFNHDYVNKILHENNIVIGSVSDDFFLQHERSDILSGKILEHMERVFMKMSQLKTSLYVLPLLEKMTLKNLEIKNQIHIFEQIQKIVPKNIKICIESDLNSENIKMLFNSIDKNIFKINYDIGNSAYEGYNFQNEFDDYFELIENIHIKDRLFQGKTVPLGEGDASITNVLKELKKLNYEKNLILQAARIPGMKDKDVMIKYKTFVENALL